jgi:formylglycine-generating enzyme required for sulfatase activity
VQVAETSAMVRLPGGTFTMGSDEFYPEEAPVRTTTVGPFAIDRHPVTVAEFRRFVTAAGYVTVAERTPDPATYPDADPRLLVPGSLVFHRTRGPVRLDDVRAWWRYEPAACWTAPEGPGSTVRGRHRHPVTHVAYDDALAYARWAGKDLPSEAEWEYAARGGLDCARFAWGDELTVGGRMMANWWQGRFPWENTREDGYEGTSPVGAFPPNGYGLFDVCGNVWEWTRDPYRQPASAAPCCGPEGTAGTERRVIKGGSHLCAPNYCLRFRPAARQGETVDTSTSHIGFRCVVRR